MNKAILKDTSGPGKTAIKLTRQPGSGYTVGTADNGTVKFKEGRVSKSVSVVRLAAAPQAA